MERKGVEDWDVKAVRKELQDEGQQPDEANEGKDDH